MLRTRASCERTLRRLMQNLTRRWRYKKLFKLFHRFYDSIASVVSEVFCFNLKFGNRRNPLHISRFSNQSVGAKDPLSAADDWFGGSQDFQTDQLGRKTR